jgi:hypothetical protein
MSTPSKNMTKGQRLLKCRVCRVGKMPTMGTLLLKCRVCRVCRVGPFYFGWKVAGAGAGAGAGESASGSDSLQPLPCKW